MDVRCENCKVEYELDESRLKTGGITVKCANCGHMFKIRRRSPTASMGTHAGAVPRPQPAASSGPVRGRAGTGPSRARPATNAGGEKAPAKRSWLIRLASGEVKKCRELKLLQQWIVAGNVTRECHISRSGQTWKPLGKVPELASYFDIADEASQQAPADRRRPRPTSKAPPPAPRVSRPITSPGVAAAHAHGKPDVRHNRPATQPPPVPDQSVRPMRASTPPPVPDQPVRPARASTPPPAGPRPTAGSSQPLRAESEPAGPRPTGKSPSLRRDAQNPDDADRATGSWAVQAKVKAAESSDGPVGPTGGLAKGIPTHDVAFAGGGGAFAEPDDPLDDEMFAPPKRGGGRWLVIGSLVLIVGAAAAIYLLVLRGGDKDKQQVAAPVTVDAGVGGGVEMTSLDAGAAAPSADRVHTLAVAHKWILSDDTDALDGAGAALAALPKASDDVGILVTRARVDGAIAQAALYAAAIDKDAAVAKKLRAGAKRRATKAYRLALKALAHDRKDVSALVVAADLLRLRGKRARDVQAKLRAAKRTAPKDRELLLVEARMLIARKRLTQGRRILSRLDRGLGGMSKSGDVRPRLALAVLHLQAKAYDKARAGALAVLAVQANSATAKAVMAAIDAATVVSTSDPMPSEDKPAPGTAPDSSGASAVDSYDALLKKADKLAEGGRCSQAMKHYSAALDENPAGVAALTGMGYCHLNANQYASAAAKFNAALGVSPRYQEAMYGVAELYQQQGNKPKAIKLYKKFIETHPSSGRARMAKRQIDKLGGTVDKPSGTTDKPSGTVDKPSGTVDKPSGTTDKPSGTVDKPSGTTDKPSGTVDKPSGTTDTPEAKKPVPEAKKPAPEAKKPEPAPEAKKPEPAPEAKKPEPAPEAKKPEPAPSEP